MSRLLIAAILGGVVLATPTFLGTRAWYQRATLKARMETLEAQAEKIDLERALADARANLLSANAQLNAILLEDRNEKQARLDGVAAQLDDLGRRVSTCASKSDVRVTITPTGTIETVSGGELRNLAESVREFAQACAVGRDRDAIDHNKLIDWFSQLPKILEAK